MGVIGNIPVTDSPRVLVESAADSVHEVLALSTAGADVLVGWDGCEVRLCHPCARVCARVSRVCPGSPRCLFTVHTLTVHDTIDETVIKSTNTKLLARGLTHPSSPGHRRALFPSS